MPTRPTTKALKALAACSAVIPLIAMAPDIKRESTQSRDALTELETKPFDTAALASLTDWSHPGTLDESNTAGKVVVLAVVSASDPQSIMTISTLTRLQEDYANEGVVIAAIHPDAGFDEINQRILDGKITIPVARDEGAVFAQSMHTDDYPDLYLIDRAGNLRFADLHKRSLKDAVKLLASETTETAHANAALQAQGLSPETDTLTAADFKPSDYKRASWPAHNPSLYAKDLQGQTLPVALGSEEWLSEEIPLEGKVVVLDFWATWCGPCRAASPILQKLQIQNPDTLAILAIAGQNDPEATVRRYVAKHKVKYSNLYDVNQSVYKPFESRGIPLVVVMSTDGVIRWMGNPHSEDFVPAVNKVLSVDPVIAANN